MEKLRFRTKVKHFYNKSKRNILNLRLNFLTYHKFLNLKKNSIENYESLQNYFDVNKIKIIEGNSTQSKKQEEYLLKYKEKFGNILEIGFNAGHSAELFLYSNPYSTVTSVDIGYWYYCKFGATYLNKKYPGRIKNIFKDSLLALNDNSFIDEEVLFDFIYIDGNHTYEYALNDILNCKKFAKPSSILVLDDVVINESYRTNSNREPTKVWEELVRKNYISEIDYAHFKDINRGVAVGKYNFYE